MNGYDSLTTWKPKTPESNKSVRQLEEQQYLEDARTIGRWIVSQLTDMIGSSFGGYVVGFKDGVGMSRDLNEGKSAENNAVIFSAFSALAAIEQELGNTEASQIWTDRAIVAGDFVINMYNSAVGCFDVGTFRNPPITGPEMINSTLLLDAQTIPILTLATAPRYRNLLDWKLPLQCVLTNLIQSIMVGELSFNGFHLAQLSPPDILPVIPPGIAWEFTAQTIVAMRVIDALFQEDNFAQQIESYLGQLNLAQQFGPFTDGMGLVASTLPEGGSLPPRNHCLPTPFQCIPTRVGLAATNWAIFADQDINPFPEDRLTTPSQARLPKKRTIHEGEMP